MIKEREEMKKHYILYILDVIKENSDKDNPITQVRIQEILREHPYNVEIERKAIQRTIDDLLSLKYPIGEVTTDKNGKEVFRNGKPLRQGVYYAWDEEEITDSQIYLLIDSVLSSPHISNIDADKTIAWLRKQASFTFRQKYATARSKDYGRHIEEREVLLTIEVIDEAVRGDHQIAITYNDFDKDGRLKTKCKEVVINPYYTVIRNGHYYLICSKDGENEFYHYRLDKISDAYVLENTKRLPVTKIKRDFDLNTYIQQHPYMFAGEVKMVKFLVDERQIGALYDYFGNDAFRITAHDKENEKFSINMRTNLEGFYYWALQYGESVEVLEPQELRDKMRNMVRKMTRTYLITNDDMYSEAISSAEKCRLIIGENKRTRLDISGINLQGKSKHLDILDATFLAVGYNSLSSYEFINRYQNLTSLIISESAIVNGFVLNLPNLRRLTFREELSYRKRDSANIQFINNFNFLSNCRKIISIDAIYSSISSFEGIYGFTELEKLRIGKKDYEKLDLTRFLEEPEIKEERNSVVISFPEVIRRHRERNESLNRRRD